MLIPVAFTDKDDGGDASVDVTPTMRCGGAGGGGAQIAVAVDVYNHAIDGDVTATLNANSGTSNHSGPKVMSASAVRRLTPRECERLQGFPNDWTFVPYRNKDAADGPRYRALGNSMAVPVMRHIGERIALVELLGEHDTAA